MAAFKLQIQNQVKVIRTRDNYLGSIKQFLQYTHSINYNAFYHEIDYRIISYFLLHRIHEYGTKCWNSQIAAIAWFCDLIGTSINWKNNNKFLQLKADIIKTFDEDPIKAEPIFIDFIIKYFKYRLFNINNAKHICWDQLVIFVLIQLYALTGARISELVKYNRKNSNKGLKYKSIKFCSEKYKNKRINYIKLTILAGEYKNAKSKNKDKILIIGETNHPIIDPYKLLKIYLKTVKFNKKKNKPNWKWQNNDLMFIFSSDKPVTTNDITDEFHVMLDDMKINKLNNDKKYGVHGMRSGLASWLRDMNTPIEQISLYIGWSVNWLQSAMFGYFRFSNVQKALLTIDIVNHKPKKPISIIIGQ